jgi:hypothetical protein
MLMNLNALCTALLVTVLYAPASAQPRKCTAPDGKVTYSDVACPDRTAFERAVEVGGNTLDGSTLREQAQKDKAVAAQAQAAERERFATESTAVKQEMQKAQSDATAYANCIRDVESQSITEDIRAELFAACRTAGASRRHSGMTNSFLRDCVRNVERTGAIPNNKARQIAICHGADVLPDPPVVAIRAKVRAIGPHRVHTCSGNQCSDDAGQRYFKQQGTGLVREDGKSCQLTESNVVSCP